MKSDNVIKKFTKRWKLSDFQILTDDGFIDIVGLGETIPYVVYVIRTEDGCELQCADEHIVFGENFNEQFVKDIKVGDYVYTINGLSKVISCYTTDKFENMYDFELSDKSKHRYYTNGILSHNTILAKTLAKEIFGDEKYLIRFDMSEYVDQTSVNKLIGSSAGYVGYNEGGLLTEAVKRQKYAVLLIDEIEKANEQVYNLFLQILDEGYLNDNMGQKVDFRNTIVILTSNVGTKRANQTHALGFNADEDVNKKDIIEKELKKKFPPEFINRLDSIVYFNRLTDENLKDIIKLELNKTVKKIEEIGHHIEYNQEVIENLFNIVAKEREYGARPIIRAICNEIENPITDLLIENDYNKHTFVVVVNNNEIKIN